jgi:hypothetical protein
MIVYTPLGSVPLFLNFDIFVLNGIVYQLYVDLLHFSYRVVRRRLHHCTRLLVVDLVVSNK